MLKLFDGATYTVSRNIVIRQEIFGGLLFDRLNFLIYRLTPKSYDLFSYFYRPAMDFKQIIDSLCIKQDELEKFIRFSLNHKFLVRANTQEEIIPSTKYQYTCAIDLLDGDAERCKPTASLVATLRAPTFVWWDITYLCNFSCTYCYSSAGIKSKDELSFESVCRILDELRNAGVFYVFFLGGEPLLRNDIFDILSYAQEIGLGTMITSNGWFIDRDTANKLYNTGVTIARVSIDGYQSSTHDRIRNKSGSWNKAADAVKHLVAANMPRVGISPTVMSENIEEMGDLIKWAYENGVNEIQITPLCATGRGSVLPELSFEHSMRLKDIVAISKARYDLMINAPEGIDDNKPAHCYVKQSGVTPLLSGCGAGRNSIALSPTGDVFPCILNRRSVGNIMDYTHFSDFLQSEALLELRNKRAACSECKYENCCAGLCRLMGERDSLDCKVINK